MQAIARVRRAFTGKPAGLVVDYLGLAHEMKAGLTTYTESGGSGRAALDREEAVAVMPAKYQVCRGSVCWRCGVLRASVRGPLDWRGR